jgi:opacity protein-like surface antigen
MKSVALTALAALVLTAGSAFATQKIQVSCQPSGKFAGNGAIVHGTLIVDSTAGQYPQLTQKSKLDIFVGGSSRTPIFSAKGLAIEGVQLDDQAIQAVAPKAGEIALIYLNKDLSYVEIDGIQYRTDCSK